MSAGSDAALMMIATLQRQVAALEERVHALEAERRAPAPVPAVSSPAAPGVTLPATVDERRAREKAEILAALDATGWNRLEAARELGMPRRTFYRRIMEYGIQEGDSRTGVTKREAGRRKRPKG
jgi:transcriptional regulator of acetoin/glycerol metabolism